MLFLKIVFVCHYIPLNQNNLLKITSKTSRLTVSCNREHTIQKIQCWEFHIRIDLNVEFFCIVKKLFCHIFSIRIDYFFASNLLPWILFQSFRSYSAKIEIVTLTLGVSNSLESSWCDFTILDVCFCEWRSLLNSFYFFHIRWIWDWNVSVNIIFHCHEILEVKRRNDLSWVSCVWVTKWVRVHIAIVLCKISLEPEFS